MPLATTLCRAAIGVEAPLISIETHLANGLPTFNIVGLPEKAVQESRERVRCALQNSGFEFPNRRITVNLAPADLPKQGSRFDLAIAVGILIASTQLPESTGETLELLGELTLAGAVRPVNGALPVALAAQQAGHGLALHPDNLLEASLIKQATLYGVDHLLTLCAHLTGATPLQPTRLGLEAVSTIQGPDLSDVRGQSHAKRALEVAAAGRHNLLMMGPPGAGKSMLANRLPGLLPAMTEAEALESAAIASVAGQPPDLHHWRQRPFRAPHHTCSGVALVGGGGNPKPGEISLAHNGVLFLDELPEFDNRVLDVLREPMESGEITIARAARSARFAARFQVIAALNPCKCGFYGDEARMCASCGPQTAARYQSRLSGPLRDRMDIQIEVPALKQDELFARPASQGETSAQTRQRVEVAWRHQIERQGCANALLSGKSLEIHCRLDQPQQNLLGQAIEQLGLSARAYHRILRMARTIADLDQAETLETPHLSEAIGYRRLNL